MTRIQSFFSGYLAQVGYTLNMLRSCTIEMYELHINNIINARACYFKVIKLVKCDKRDGAC